MAQSLRTIIVPASAIGKSFLPRSRVAASVMPCVPNDSCSTRALLKPKNVISIFVQFTCRSASTSTTGSNRDDVTNANKSNAKQRHLIVKPSLTNNAGEPQMTEFDSQLLMEIDAALAASPDARLNKLRRATTNTLQALLMQPSSRQLRQRRQVQHISSYASSNASDTSNHIFIQADGVFLPDFGVGGAGIHFGGTSAQRQQHIVIPRMDPIILPYLESSFDADVQAIYAAVLIAQKIRGAGEHVVILTDSAVVVDRLGDAVKNDWLQLQHVDSILVGDAKRKARRAARRARKLLLERAIAGASSPSQPPLTNSPVPGGDTGSPQGGERGPSTSTTPSSPSRKGGNDSPLTPNTTTAASRADTVAYVRNKFGSSSDNNARKTPDKW